MSAAPSFCDIVRAEVDRGGASVGNALGDFRDLAFQTRYRPSNYFGAGAGDARRAEVQSYADNIQQKAWQLQARYGADAPTNLAWWRYPLCKTPESLAAQGLPYYNRAYLRDVAGYKMYPVLQLSPPNPDAGVKGYAFTAVDAIVPDGLADRVPLFVDRVAEPKLAVVLGAMLIVAFIAALLLIVYVRGRAARSGLRAEAKEIAAETAAAAPRAS